MLGCLPFAQLQTRLLTMYCCVCAITGACFWRGAVSSALFFLTLHLPLAALKTSLASECSVSSLYKPSASLTPKQVLDQFERK
jgi:hypothetical protein